MTGVHTVATFAGIDTYHVQGVARRDDTVFVSTTERRSRSGYLLKAEIGSGQARLLHAVPLAEGNRIHPGGIFLQEDRLLVPLAPTRNQGDTFILALDPATLSKEHLFTVATHIGAVAFDGANTIFGADFDTRRLFVWDVAGRERAVIPNPTTIAYQDMEWYRERLYCSGVEKRDRSLGRVDVFAYDDASRTIVLERSVVLPRIAPRTNLGREGMTIYNGSFFFLPEDDEQTTLYRIETSP
jgi:hypothetical protein